MLCEYYVLEVGYSDIAIKKVGEYLKTNKIPTLLVFAYLLWEFDTSKWSGYVFMGIWKSVDSTSEQQVAKGRERRKQIRGAIKLSE